MASCELCRRRLAFKGRRTLERMRRVEVLIHQLAEVDERARREPSTVPPVVRSAMLAVASHVFELLAEGADHSVDLHEFAHDRNYSIDIERVDQWMDRARTVLREMLAALEWIDPLVEPS